MALTLTDSALEWQPARSHRPERPPPPKTWPPANGCGAQARDEAGHACNDLLAPTTLRRTP
eukprot:14973243-Alexandrium_andersonii.AAC.1